MVSSTPRPNFTLGKDPVRIVQEAGWVPGPAWTGGKSRPHRDSISDRPARSQSLYRVSYPAHLVKEKGSSNLVQNMGHKGPALRPRCVGPGRARTQMLLNSIQVTLVLKIAAVTITIP